MADKDFQDMAAAVQKSGMQKAGGNRLPSFVEGMRDTPPTPRGLTDPAAQIGKEYFRKGGMVRKHGSPTDCGPYCRDSKTIRR